MTWFAKWSNKIVKSSGFCFCPRPPASPASPASHPGPFWMSLLWVVLLEIVYCTCVYCCGILSWIIHWNFSSLCGFRGNNLQESGLRPSGGLRPPLSVILKSGVWTIPSQITHLGSGDAGDPGGREHSIHSDFRCDNML
jgi:hypothetical protein